MAHGVDATPHGPDLDAMLVRPITTLVPERLAEFPPWVGHIPFAFWLVEALQPRSIVELGTASGNSYCAFLQASRALGLQPVAVAVDHWAGDGHSSFYDGAAMLADLKAHHDPRYGDFSTLLQMSFDDALDRIGPRSVDLLHIDGFHTYEAVSHDFRTWLPKVSGRGVVLFHDVTVREKDFGVWRFWDEIQAAHPTFTFVHSHGLGVAYLGSEPPPPDIAWLLDAGHDPARTDRIRSYFAALGRGLLDRFHARSREQQLRSLEHHARSLEDHARSLEDHARSLEEQVRRAAESRSHPGLEERIRDLTRLLLAQQEEKAALRQEGAALRDRVAGLEAIADARARLAERMAAAARSAAAAALPPPAIDTAPLHARIAELEQAVRAYHQSTSWRLTRPLRGAMRLLRGEITPRQAAALARRTRELPHSALPRAAPAALPPPDAAGPNGHRPPSAAARAAADRYITTHPDLDTADLPPLDASVSVVIPTFNAGAELPWLVRNLFAQKGLRSVEVVTVDSGSTDGTAARVAALGCKVVEIEQSRFSHSYSRNLGAEHATGDFLVFMVQDAYPVGDHWLYGLARCLLHPRSEETRLSAVSCAEHSRSDSELFYDALLRGHYGFLGCGDRDRVGRFVSEDQAELRRQGQLSDVACMIPRALFNEYRFHGRYAEDLTLGMRMIRDGHQIGMLSSIRVIHSHTRPPGYYVRRIFADVMFQSALFPEVAVPQGNSATGSLAAAFALRRALKPTIPSSHQSPAEAIEGVIRRLRGHALPDTIAPFPADEDFGHPPLGVWIRTLGECATAAERPMTRAEARSARQMRDIVIDKLVWLLGFVPEVYPVLDETVAAELDAAIEKCLAMAVGTQLALCYLSPVPSLNDDGTEALVRDLKTILLAGI